MSLVLKVIRLFVMASPSIVTMGTGTPRKLQPTGMTSSVSTMVTVGGKVDDGGIGAEKVSHGERMRSAGIRHVSISCASDLML